MSTDNFVAMLSNGTSGDINNIDFHGKRAPRQPFEQCRIVAAKVADASWRASNTSVLYKNHSKSKHMIKYINNLLRRWTP